MPYKFFVDPDISRAETLPASFYTDNVLFGELKQKAFLRSWQWIGDSSLVQEKNTVYPFTLLNDYLTEPMLLTKASDNTISCLSNVCTHRANLVAYEKGVSKKLVCKYHGRRFDLKGTFEHMPEFENTKDFPRPCDNLNRFPLIQWGPLLFAGLNPAFDFQEVLNVMNDRIGFMDLEHFKEDNTRHKDFYVNAHWALYCDNYLEGFHVPFVHNDLNAVLDYGSYTTEIYKHCNLQIGYTESAENTFDLPEDHVDFGKHVAAYYFWVFPNMMFNFYPWGLSINIVKPISINKTKVSFRSYVYDPTKLETGAGSDLDKVELEDEEVVENVQKGVRSAFYKAGRFSPTREQGVHHFHRLLADFINQ